MTKTAYCFDLDGTVTKEEVLPILSREVGLFEEISALTDATIQGVIPFRKSFLLRCRLLNEIPVSRVREIVGAIPLHDRIVDFIAANRDDCFVITGNLDAWVAPLQEKIDCRFFCSSAGVQGDRLVNVDHVLNKADAVAELRKNYDRIVAVGDGMGDVPMFESSDVCIAYGGVHYPIQTLVQESDFITFDEGALCRLLNTL